MIMHVAQADEQRGRVVLWLGASGEPQEVAVDAAVCLAQAFQSEIESLFIEDRQLFDLAELPFAREISLSGRSTRAMSANALAQDMQSHASALHRRVLARARAADVKAKARVIREEPVRALAQACAENGPWNVVTVGTPLTRGTEAGLADLFHSVIATTGVVVTGPRARRTQGPVIAVVEELERVVPMMRAAERIASATGGETQLWLLEQDQDRQDWIEGQIRLALGSHSGVKFQVIDMMLNKRQDVARMIRREGAGFVIARFGGLLAPDEVDVIQIAETIEGPLFLVR
ncbi:hypothetical protein [Hyphomicrobium sp. LHD-15]|uniref:hypothetical protein n=1 Tax=Hyphomicrobium sp. LHD-15 TaxID=3072142 RepID=UPI00280D9A3D|nr:hypothetical protein [Hyphomicrobium sp. LHD-15]MDQ8699947.1 hypothetical protein [Hyphomicrobium sp. LHD-15]